MKKITFLIAAVCLFFIGGNYLKAQTTIDFNSNGWTNAQNLTSTITEGGFSFTYESSPGVLNDMLANTIAANGAAGFACGAFVSTDLLTIASTDGSEFDFISFYAFNAFTGTMRIRGFRDGVLVATSTGFTVTNSAVNPVSAVNIDFQDVDTVIFDSASGGFGLASGYDDFVFGTAIPALDTTPPVFENSTPNQSSVSQTGFTLGTDIDEEGTIYYVVVADGTTAPTSAEVKAGTGSGGTGEITTGNAIVNSGGFTNNFNVTGLTAGTAYDVYVVAEDDETSPNLQVSPTKIDVTTAPLITLTITGLTGDNKVYDGTTAATASGSAALSGVAAGDDVTIGGTPSFAFASANVGTGISINSTGYTISGADAGNYTLTQPTLSADIVVASLSITGLTGDNKVYDGTTVATASGSAALSGVAAGDDVTLGGAPSFAFASANVGTGISINSTGYTISGADAGNYTLTQPTLSADIVAASLSITGLTGDNKVYDGTTVATASGSAALSGVAAGDDVTLGGAPSFVFASANVGTGISINSTGYTISGADAGNYTLTQPTLSADIVAASLSITGLTGDNKVYDGTTAATASGSAALSGVAAGDDVTLAGAPAFVFASADVGTGISINSTGYTISGADAGNYTLTQPTLSADIVTVNLTVTGLTGNDKPFDGTTVATASGTASLSGVIGADVVTLGGSPTYTFASAAVGTGITITTTGFTISGTDAGNYTLTQPTLSADITGITLTISGLTGDNKAYDGNTTATASGTATLSGVIGTDVVTLGGSPVFSFASSNTGTGISINTTGYTISGADAGNYTLMQPTLSADITAINLTISGLTGDNKAYDGTTAATASGSTSLSSVVAGDDVTIGGTPSFTFASANVGTGISITTSGYTISGADAGNYTLTQPTLSADIIAASLTVTGLTGNDKPFDGTTSATVSGTPSLSGVIGADVVTLGGSPTYTFASAAVGTGITITTTGFTISGTDAGNYTLTQPTLSANIIGDTLIIDDISIVDVTCNGDADGSATVTVSGGSAPYSYEWSTGATTTGNTLSGLPGGNYSVTVVDALNNSVMQDFTIAEGDAIDVTVTEETTVYFGYYPASYAWVGVEGVTGGQGPYTYEWNTGETTQNIHVCPTETTTYTVTVTDANGCSTTANVIVNVVDVRCNHGHRYKVKICHNGRTICVPWWSVKWYLWCGATLGGCDSDTTQVQITNLKVFPNPFRNYLFVKFNSNTAADIDLKIFNNRGRLVFHKTLSINEGKTKTRLNLSKLRRGSYYLKVVINGDVKKVRHLLKR